MINFEQRQLVRMFNWEQTNHHLSRKLMPVFGGAL